MGGLHLDALLNAEGRNALEHFDEALDRTGISWQKGLRGSDTLIPMDSVFGSRATVETLRQGVTADATIYTLRAYFAAERVFLNAGKETQVGEMLDEARAVVERLQPIVAPEGIPGGYPGGYEGQRLAVVARLLRPSRG